MLRSRCLAGVLLASVLAASCAEIPPIKPSFADYLAAKQRNMGAAQTQGSSYYEARQVEHSCLREAIFKNCRDPDGPGLMYFESGVQCCDGKSSGLGTSTPEVGACKYNYYWFSSEITEATGVWKLGEYSVQCYLNNAADTCGHPFCDQMVLQSSGGIYYTDDAVLSSRPPEPIEDTSCGGDGGERRNKISAIQARRSSKKSGGAGGGSSGSSNTKAGVKSEATHPAGHYDDERYSAPNLYSGEAIIFFGPMTVNSRLHDVKVTEGWFEYVYWGEAYTNDDGAPIAVSEDAAQSKHVVDPFTYSLKFYKPHAY